MARDYNGFRLNGCEGGELHPRARASGVEPRGCGMELLRLWSPLVSKKAQKQVEILSNLIIGSETVVV